jgi:hypothetical protein
LISDVKGLKEAMARLHDYRNHTVTAIKVDNTSSSLVVDYLIQTSSRLNTLTYKILCNSYEWSQNKQWKGITSRSETLQNLVFYENLPNEADLFSLLKSHSATLNSIRVYCMEQNNQYSLFGKDDKVHQFFALVPEGL